MKKLIKKKKNSYTEEEKIQAVRLLKENNINHYLTAAQTGVSISSLHNWSARYMSDIDNTNKVQIIAESVELNLARVKTNFINKHYAKMNELAEEAVKKAIDLVKDETDLNKVNNTIKVISDFFGKMSNDGEEGEKKGDSYSLIQQTIIACNSMNQQ